MTRIKTTFPQKNFASVGLKTITIGYLLFLGISLFSCHSAKDVKNDTSNAAIEKIASLSKNNILVCAHRAFHTNAPENSLLSIKNAIQAGIDIVEIDVRTTKDSVLVLMHDKDIDRETAAKGLISQYTFKELQQFNLKLKDSITKEKIPLLEEALKMAKGKVIVNLDLKAVNYKQLYKMLQKYGMEHEVISFVATEKEVNQMISIDPLYAIMPLVKTKDQMIYFHQRIKSPLQHFTDDSFTQENMNWGLANGKIIFVNTLWDEDKDFILGKTTSLDKVIALKPAIIQTDHPKMLVDYLRAKNLHK